MGSNTTRLKMINIRGVTRHQCKWKHKLIIINDINLNFITSNSCVICTFESDCRCYCYPVSGTWTGSNISRVTFTSVSDCRCYCYPVSGTWTGSNTSRVTFTSMSDGQCYLSPVWGIWTGCCGSRSHVG